MATFNIYRLRLLGPVDGIYQNGYIVYVKWDDVAEDFQIDLHDDTDTYVSSPASGPDLTIVDYIEVAYNYQFCDSSTLVTFTPNYTTYPYAVRNETADHAICAISHVCDITVTDVATTNATTSTSTDGQAVVTVEGDAVSWVYSLDKYFSTIQFTNVFTGLPAGDYTAYARDKYGCAHYKSFTIGFDSTYSVRYRHEFESNLKQMEGIAYRIDIKKRDYAGAVENVKAQPVPILIKYEGDNEDKYKQIISSKATINLISEYEGQYAEVFTGDEREFLVEFYIDDVIEWKGYVIQEGTQEDYIAVPYPFTILATDGLADLQDDYNDGNLLKGQTSLLSMLVNCLTQTDLNFNIRSFINRFEVNHDTDPEDDPLPQTFFNSYFLNEYTKDEVLTELLKTFGARIYQSSGYWNVISIEDTVADEPAYREFTSLGVYVTNDTLELSKSIKFPDQSNALWWTGDPLLRIRPGYRRVEITHDLNLINNIYFEGRFDEDDYNEISGLFDNIGITLGGSGVDFGLSKTTKDGETKESLFVDFSNASLIGVASAYTQGKNVIFEQAKDVFKFSFEYYVSTLYRPTYIRFQWLVQVGTSYLQSDGSFSSNPIYQYNTIYVESFDTWEKFELTYKLPYLLTGDTTLSVIFLGNTPYDASSLAAFKTFDVSPTTTSYIIGDRRIALDNVGGVLLKRHYRLDYDPVAESSPDILHPNDYHATTNPRVWKLEDTTQFEALAPQVEFYEIDNLKLEFYPSGLTPDEEKLYGLTVSNRNKIDLPIDVIFGDLPTTINAVFIYKNYLSLSDGTPTSLWGRDTIEEELPLLEILNLDYAGQFPQGLRLLSGFLVGDFTYRMENFLIDDIDGKRYMNMGLEIDHRNNTYRTEIVEVSSGATGPPADTSGFTTGFSLGFRA